MEKRDHHKDMILKKETRLKKKKQTTMFYDFIYMTFKSQAKPVGRQE